MDEEQKLKNNVIKASSKLFKKQRKEVLYEKLKSGTSFKEVYLLNKELKKKDVERLNSFFLWAEQLEKKNETPL
jgi:hypothetical protein